MTGPLIPPGAPVDDGDDDAHREQSGVMPGEPVPDEEPAGRSDETGAGTQGAP